MRIAIVGAGALGSLFGGILSRHNHDVWLYNPSNIKHIEAIQSHGLEIQSAHEVIHVKPNATTQIEDIPLPVDLIGIFVKAYDTEKAVKAALPLINEQSWILSLQNGVGSEEIIAELISKGTVIRGVTAQGATFVSPGVIRWGGQGNTRIAPMGVLSDSKHRELRDLCKQFSNSEWASEAVAAIEPLLWEKVIVNVGINPLTAIFDVPNGRLLEDSNLRAIMKGLVAEAFLIAAEHGVRASFEETLDRVEHVCERTAANISSMLQDVRRNKRTEVEYINGAIVSEAERLGLACPLNRLVLALLMERDRPDGL